MSLRYGLNQPGVRAALGAALLFGAGTPLAAPTPFGQPLAPGGLALLGFRNRPYSLSLGESRTVGAAPLE
jgi:hypothetical protein